MVHLFFDKVMHCLLRKKKRDQIVKTLPDKYQS